VLSRLNKTLILTSAAILSQPLSAVYAMGGNNNDFQIETPDEAITNIPALIGFAVQLLFIVAGLVAFVYLMLGGIKWITSGGDKGQVEAARNQIIQALIGLVVVFVAWGLIVLIENLFGLCLGFSCAFKLPDPDTLRTP
jgi:hypothetical protein